MSLSPTSQWDLLVLYYCDTSSKAQDCVYINNIALTYRVRGWLKLFMQWTALKNGGKANVPLETGGRGKGYVPVPNLGT